MNGQNPWVVPLAIVGSVAGGFLLGWVVKSAVDERKRERGILETVVDKVVDANVGRMGLPVNNPPPNRDPGYTVGQFHDPNLPVTESDRAGELLMYL